MSSKQRLFAIALANCNSVANAADQVGIRPEDGFKWVVLPGVRSLVKAIQEEQEYSSLINQRMIEGLWLELIPKLMGYEDVPILDKDGVQLYGKKFHDSAMVSLLKDMRNHISGGDGSDVSLPKTINFIVKAPDNE